jgi:hypothetical protein
MSTVDTVQFISGQTSEEAITEYMMLQSSSYLVLGGIVALPE